MITRKGGKPYLDDVPAFDIGFWLCVRKEPCFSAFPTHKNYGYWDVPATHWWAWWANWPQHCHSPGVRKASQKSILSAFSNRIHAGSLLIAGFCRFQATKTRIYWWYPKVSQVRSNLSHSQSREALGKGNLNWGPWLNFVSPTSCHGGMNCCTPRRGNVGFLLNFLGTGWIPAPHEGETTRRLSWRNPSIIKVNKLTWNKIAKSFAEKDDRILTFLCQKVRFSHYVSPITTQGPDPLRVDKVQLSTLWVGPQRG